jgi:endonuclease-3
MSTTIRPTKHLVNVYELLIQTYGEPKNEPDYDPLGGLVGTILSQHTSDINSDRAYRQLVTAFPVWEQVRDAPTNKIVEAIKCGGLATIKAQRIQDALFTLTERQQAQGGTKSLAEYLYRELMKRSLEDARSYLLSITGVGPKTAACVLMFNLNRPVLPVDTHVLRVSHRLGLIGPKVNADQAHTLMAKITPPEWVYPLHVNLIKHGRHICHAQRPKCKQCPLFEECTYVGSVLSQVIVVPG